MRNQNYSGREWINKKWGKERELGGDLDYILLKDLGGFLEVGLSGALLV